MTILNSISVAIDQTPPVLEPGNENTIMLAMSAMIDTTVPVLEPGNENVILNYITATLLDDNLVAANAPPVGYRTYKKR